MAEERVARRKARDMAWREPILRDSSGRAEFGNGDVAECASVPLVVPFVLSDVAVVLLLESADGIG